MAGIYDESVFRTLPVHKSQDDYGDAKERNDPLYEPVGFWKPTSDFGFIRLGEYIWDKGQQSQNA